MPSLSVSVINGIALGIVNNNKQIFSHEWPPQRGNLINITMDEMQERKEKKHVDFLSQVNK